MGTTDQIRAAEETRLQTIAPAIAAGLGLAIKPAREGDFPTRSIVTLVGANDVYITLCVAKYGAKYRGKLSIDGSTYQINPSIASSVTLPDGVRAGAILVSLDKTPEAIVSDIKRRFLGAYLAELDAVRAAVAAELARRGDIVARTRTLAAVIGAPIREHNGGTLPTLNIYGSRDLAGGLADVTIQSDGVKIDRLYVSDECAAEILRVMARFHKAAE